MPDQAAYASSGNIFLNLIKNIYWSAAGAAAAADGAPH